MRLGDGLCADFERVMKSRAPCCVLSLCLWKIAIGKAGCSYQSGQFSVVGQATAERFHCNLCSTQCHPISYLLDYLRSCS